MHIPVMQREKAAILYLRRRFGYSINVIAKAFGRSTSLVQRILKFNEALGTLPWMSNKRKIPPRVRRLALARMERQMSNYMKLWMAFLLGTEDKPP
jgi:transposase